MGYGRFVGRVGALAVALGAGAAIASMPAVAFADETGPGSATVPSSSVGSASGGSSTGSESLDSDSDASADVGSAGAPEAALYAALTSNETAADDEAAADDEVVDADAGSGADSGSDSAEIVDEALAGSSGSVAEVESSSVVEPTVIEEDAPSASASVSAPSGEAEASQEPAVAGPVPNGDSVAVSVPVEVAQVGDGPTVMSSNAGLDAGSVIDGATGPLLMTAAAKAPKLTRATAQQLVRQDKIDSAVRGFFNAAESRLRENLPPSEWRDFLTGALLLVRKTLFNQAPIVVPSQQSTSESDGTFGGRIGAYDHENDTLTYIVIDDGQHGTATVDVDGVWTYTPDAEGDFTGTDSFTLRIDAKERWLNLSNLGSDGDRVVTINIGEPTYLDTPDIGVGLFDASGRLTIAKKGLGHTGTVTLDQVGPDTEWTWMDTSGLFGKVSTEHVEAFFPVFEAKSAENGATVDLTLSYTAADGSEHAVVLNSVQLGTNDGRQDATVYVLTGQLARDADSDPNGVDNFDIIGNHVAPMEDDFRAAHDLGGGLASILRGWVLPFSDVEVDFSGAEVYLDTLTPMSYQRAGMYAQDYEAQPPPDSVGTADSLTSNNGVKETSGVSASLALGRSTVIGRKDGSVELWIDGERTLLHDAGWEAPIEQLIEYNRTLKDDQGNTIDSTFSGYISGTTLTVTALGVGSTVKVGSVITGDGVAPGTTITKFIGQTTETVTGTKEDGCQGCTADILVGAGGSEGYTGTYEVGIARGVGGSFEYTGTQTVGSPTQSAGSTAPPGITFTQKNVPAVSPGFIAGLGAGSIQYWQPATGWIELRGVNGFDVTALDVTAMATFGESLVVGNVSGDVDMWSPPDAVKPGWTRLFTGQGIADADNAETWDSVTAIVEVGSPATQDHGIVVAWGWVPLRPPPSVHYDDTPGSVSFWEPTISDPFCPECGGGLGGVWTDLTGFAFAPTAMHTYGTGVAVGLADGSVHYWDGTIAAGQGWTELGGTGDSGQIWGREVSALLPYEQGLIVGLGGPQVLGQHAIPASSPSRVVSGAVQYFTGGDDYKSGEWIILEGTAEQKYHPGWDSPVTQMFNYRSDERGDGVVVGLADGSVHMWNGPLQKPAGASWTGPFGPSTLQTEPTSTYPGPNALKLGDALYSQNGRYALTLQTDGNLVLRSGEKELWASGTNGKGVVQAKLQGDGNFVLYTAADDVINGTGQNGAPIPSDTQTKNAVWLLVQNDGNVAIQSGGINQDNEYFPQLGHGCSFISPCNTYWTTNTTRGAAIRTIEGQFPQSTPEWRWWTQLHGSDWETGLGAVTALVPVSSSTKNASGDVVFQDGVIVGLNNGAVEQWSGQGDAAGYASNWTEIAWVERPTQGEVNYAAAALDRKEGFACSNWQCSQSGAMKEAVDFATAIAKSAGGVATPKWGEGGGIGSDLDPIFGQIKLQPGSKVVGTTYAVAFYKKLSPEFANYIAPNPLTFDGYIDKINWDGSTGLNEGYSVLYVKPASVKAPSKGSTVDVTKKFEAGWVVQNNPELVSAGTINILSGNRIQPDTTIKGYLGNTTLRGVNYDKYKLSFPPQTAGMSGGIVGTPFPMKILKTPAIQAGLDVIPVAYGYTHVPSSFLPKLKSSNWSFALMAALGGGPGVNINTGPNGSIWGPEETLAKKEWYKPTEFGVFAAEAGVKVGANLTLNGLPQKPSVGAHAYFYGGALATFNTVGNPDVFKFGFNWYPDVSASDFKDVSGISLTATLTPYTNFAYGLFLPKGYPIVGGWSLAKVALGYVNPISATVCVDTNNACPADTSAGVAVAYGVINDGVFNKNAVGGTVANAGLGDTLTVTQNALFNPTKFAVGQRVTGQGVTVGTTIKEVLAPNEYGDRYRVEICDTAGDNCKESPQATIGGGRNGTHPKLTAYVPGADASVTLGSNGLLTFHAGLLEAFAKTLSYDMTVPLYTFNKVLQIS